MEALTTSVLRVLAVVRVADFVDVPVVATLVYPAVVWVRRTQVWLVAAGLLILTAFYISAQFLACHRSGAMSCLRSAPGF